MKSKFKLQQEVYFVPDPTILTIAKTRIVGIQIEAQDSGFSSAYTNEMQYKPYKWATRENYCSESCFFASKGEAEEYILSNWKRPKIKLEDWAIEQTGIAPL